MAWDDDLIKGMKLSDRLTFGKHKGKTLEEVCEMAPSYVDWALENGAISALDGEARAHFEACLEDEQRERSRRRRNRGWSDFEED